MTHTPGPWTVQADSVYPGVIRDANRTSVAEAHYQETPGTMEANARLIAAAPDLLEAVRVARVAMVEARRLLYYARHADTVDRLTAAITDAEAAVQKAGGGTA